MPTTDPNFASIVRLELDRARQVGPWSTKRSRSTISEIEIRESDESCDSGIQVTRNSMASSAVTPQKVAVTKSCSETQERTDEGFQIQATNDSIQATNDSIASSAVTPQKVAVTKRCSETQERTQAKTPQKSQKNSIPDKNTRRKWMQEYFNQFRVWKESGGLDVEKPRFQVSTWTEESVFRFFGYVYCRSERRSKGKQSSTSTGASESQKRNQRNSKSKDFQQLFERKAVTKPSQRMDSRVLETEKSLRSDYSVESNPQDSLISETALKAKAR